MDKNYSYSNNNNNTANNNTNNKLYKFKCYVALRNS